jgi:type II secretion system protein G
MKRNAKGFTLIELLIVVAIIGIIAAIAIPNLLNAIERGKQKRTMADMRSIGTAIEAYSIDFSFYPTASDAGTLAGVLEPVYIKKMPLQDGWRADFDVDSATDQYTIISYAKGSAAGSCPGGTTTDFTADICFADGQFQTWPEGQQK